MPSAASALQAEVDALREELAALRAAPPSAVTPEERAVLRAAVAEYTAGHRSDSTKAPAAGDPEYLRGEYTKALTAYYRAVRAYMRANATQQKETPEDVRP